MTGGAEPEGAITVGLALRQAAAMLVATSDTARLDAELLMAHALGMSRSRMLLHGMAMPVPPVFAASIDRRLTHEPVAYIIGSQEFYGRSFVVTPDVLIPRCDSESVVEAALEVLPPEAAILDCGTGSGALLLTLLCERPGSIGTGVDISAAALQVASHNRSRLGLMERARLQRRSWAESGWATDLGRFDLVIANPPYVEDGADLMPDVALHEPVGALFSGPEGLDDYALLIPQMTELMNPGGACVLEIGATQAEAVSALAQAAGFTAVTHNDLGGRPRALVLRLGDAC
ncbi:peptide chain release factor N(5)-glutamine methyltransferase [Altererythrobacter sp. SALINAS58]|uniref:peptide chain release factor N(5)-glutamine methyltransferase n=1 Tax=Alteripontixanthobacter muriae TaxID=2705546 RepID=UPI00157683B7|nr:peptide chain release factor N(5)-glutamine methyltransferase [Alteripontixanthobacter muriae]NTZ43714.1 peptide chain release factor N(5)-glutamine methyltransferase [Alteripontixanthobacter muriae]